MKTKQSSNPFVEYYGKHSISPVHQNISDYTMHLRRREKLYSTIGLPCMAFDKKRILEIGPGGGFNALAFFSWGASVDFVEPNPTALYELPRLLGQYGVSNKKYEVYSCLIEEFKSKRTYDVVVAEGFLMGLNNKQEVIEAIAKCVKPGGVAVITCTDEIGYYFDLLRRLLADMLTKGKNLNFSAKIAVLSQAFGFHLNSLRFATRPIEDYVADLTNPVVWANEFFNSVDCINAFGDSFSLLGTSSPSIFTDMSWHKDLEYNVKESVINQYYQKRHTLLRQAMDISIGDSYVNDELHNWIYKLRMVGKSIDEDAGADYSDILVVLEYIDKIISKIDKQSSIATQEVVSIMKRGDITAESIASMKIFASTFGKSQQYVGMYRRFV